uniref:PX domain-containing protein n=1 Tax=Ciona savignyi TaxID=51511 RepID=H2ZLJ2_CIOSA
NEKLSAELKQITLSHQNSVKENEVLRSQLKKYVGAVQILESGSAEERVYEQKLVEVAEMHAELMEFNDHLHARFKSAVNFLHHMRAELIDLRGPMPTDELVDRIENDDLSGILESTPSPARISVWMPSVFLRGHGPDSSHFYQVFIRAGEEEWNVYRRYSEFYELHMQIAKKFPIVETYNFPPKKVLGNKGRRFVEERRKVLQTYIRLLINNIIRNHEKIVSNPTKQTLVALLPFFSESLSSDWDKKQHDSAKS